MEQMFVPGTFSLTRGRNAPVLGRLCRALVVALVFLMLPSTQALPLRGRDVDGVFTDVDSKSRRASMRTADGKLVTFHWSEYALGKARQ